MPGTLPAPWIFPESFFLLKSPSRSFLTISQELKARESIHDFIIRLGSHLKLDGRTILAATVYVTRYYMKVPILQSKYFVASAAIAISSKLNDTYRQPDKIALQACQLKSSLVIDEQSEMFWRWRDQLLYREELMLKVLNFELNIEVPYAIKERLDKTNQLNLDAEVPSETSLKAVISLIEVLSSLPILVSYEMSTLFAALLIMITCKAKEKLPTGYLKDNLNVEIEDAWNCYKYVLTLLGYCSGEIESNKLGVKRVDVIERDDFVSIDGVGIENT